MHILKLLEITASDAVQMEGVTLESPACQQCLLAFQENMRLAVGAAAIPGWSAMIKMLWDQSFNNAAIDQWGPDFFEKMQKAPEEEVKAFFFARHTLMSQLVSDTSPLQKDHLVVMTRELEELALRCGPFVFGMFEGILKTVCIQAWTAIEVLLEDLHGEAIDKHPACFSTEMREMRARQVSNAKGSKFYFRRRDSFREAYDFAFRSDPAINAAVGHNALDGLGGVRHLLVHKGGLVDQGFMDDVDKAPRLLKFNAALKKPLQFNGELVREIVDDAADQGYNLLRAVNAWLLSQHLAAMPNAPRTSTP